MRVRDNLRSIVISRFQCYFTPAIPFPLIGILDLGIGKLSVEKKTVLGGNIAHKRGWPNFSPKSNKLAYVNHDRERARTTQGGKRCLSRAGMGNRRKGAGSVIMLTIVPNSFLLVFTEWMTGGVVRLGIANLQAASCLSGYS
jgi:hypothetical protein